MLCGNSNAQLVRPVIRPPLDVSQAVVHCPLVALPNDHVVSASQIRRANQASESVIARVVDGMGGLRRLARRMGERHWGFGAWLPSGRLAPQPAGALGCLTP